MFHVTTMNPQNLQTASHYVNNLLLSRGLLRDGETVDFANPSKGESGEDKTRARVINLIHDMILRRDRETESLSTFSQTLSTIRSFSAEQGQVISRLETRMSDMERRLSLADARERSLRSDLKISEKRNRALREDVNRYKTAVGQIRAQCANDVRKREGEIVRLKKHLDNRRVKENSIATNTVTIVPGVTRPHTHLKTGAGLADLESPSYSLKEETTDFLTQLSQSLSDENDSMIGLVQNTLLTLRELQGLPQTGATKDGKYSYDSNSLMDIPPSYDALAIDVDETLGHLRTLLTNPSFVPLEEVEEREEEITRLREGWDRMEIRWREAISLMDSWRNRIMESGDTINLEDLRKGLSLDSENAFSPREGLHELPKPLQSSRRSKTPCRPEFDIAELEVDTSTNDVSPENIIRRGTFLAPNILKATHGNIGTSPQAKRFDYYTNPPEIGAMMDQLSDDEDFLLEDVASACSLSLKGRRAENVDSNLTVQQKLKAAEEEASRIAETGEPPDTNINTTAKRTGIPRKTKARRTLSPVELEQLIGGITAE